MQSRTMRSGALCLAAATGCAGLGAVRPADAARPTVPAVKAPSPTGRLVYKTEIDTGMGIMAGTMTLIWIDGGKKFRQETQLSGGAKGAPAGAAPTTISSWSFGDGKYLYTNMPMMGQTVYRQAMAKHAGAGAGGAIGAPPVGSGNQGKLVGKATVLGKPCEIRQIDSAKLWMWKGLALKMEKTGGQGPRMKMTASKLDMPFKANPGMFKVPAGYSVTDQMPGMPSLSGGGAGGSAPAIRKGRQ